MSDVPVRSQPSRLRRLDGRWLVAVGLGCYFGLLVLGWAVNGRAPWPRFRVQAGQLSFIDMRSITTGWECTRRGIDVLPLNPCDPDKRPANYPRIWMKLSWLGLGEGSTVALGIGTAVLFFLSVLALIGRISLREGLVQLAILTSPSVMLGVERGNADLLVFVVVVLSVLTLASRRVVLRALSHGLLLFAAILKLFPAFAFTVLLRQPRRLALLGTSLVAALFGLYVGLTWHDVHTIYSVVPKLSMSSYGFAIGPDAARAWLAAHVSGLHFLTTSTARVLVDAAMVALALLIAAWLVRIGLRRRERSAATTGVPLLAFWAGASIYVGTFLIGHNFDYRLAFLILTVPQLLIWARERRPTVPAPGWALAAMIATLWLSEALMPQSFGVASGWRRASEVFPPDEGLNWLLFAYFTAALALTLPPWLTRRAPSSQPG